ncbi:TerC/Alx family metal homeostasis membrane protein [Riemerella anatipestifer]|nr:TerC/Alx family metal homeostasis membrane protein [Riemerella anatipestifer]MCO4304432.1 TerC/Alx family metal homeostasis membrane protein [Riemerella anatipestifer]MCO7352010.1 TerC/Alx family metal homeostasis membrane protein [Riemerella anatipestifer]MCQ4038944.1 TerC/Alx family metal homeostasis membrane protein [Riemerella anatipestifer]MCT6761404.1 TerC/Alx family metal homeostasis membrane protein [Riemerella anatipestifer]MCT6764711.1 TerC/Alx family metal homeostasis membrane pr
MTNETIFLLGFLIFIGIVMALDLGVLSKSKNKKTEGISFKKALLMSIFVVCLSMVFYSILLGFGHQLHGIDSIEKLENIVHKHRHPIKIIPNDLETSIQIYNQNLGLEYLTGYVVEYALSVDNIFVIVLIFTAFGVEKRNYHRVLFWGILGAVAMRFMFIFIGAALIERFAWIMYVFGAFLVFTGIKMFLSKEEEESIDTEKHPVVKFANKYFKVHNQFVGNKFFVNIDGGKKMTPLFLVLIIIEFTDLIFAVDSIPAIFSVTKDPYIVFFSNIFAIIGLRSMFFLLAGIIDKFRFLKIGLAVLLTFIGAKMLLHHQLDELGFTTTHSLIIIVSILAVSILASLIPARKTD